MTDMNHASGEARVKAIVESLMQVVLSNGFKEDPDELRSRLTGVAHRIQGAADLLFHGALSDFDELNSDRGIVRRAIGLATAQLIVGEIFDHGFAITPRGQMTCHNKAVVKEEELITHEIVTTWYKENEV